MIKQVILAALMAGTFLTPAFGADLPTKAPAYHQVTAPVSDWTGFYVGIHGGYGWTDFSTDVDQGLTNLFGGTPQPQGFVFGGHAGYNWQYGSLVGGLEVDFSGADMNSSQSAAVAAIGLVTLDAKVDALASARARAGFLVLPSVLLYGTGGIGWAHSSATFTVSSTTATLASAEADTINFGWVAGAGAEWKIWGHLFVRAEYLHYDFSKKNYQFSITNSDIPFTVEGTNARLTTDVIRGGVSYKF